MYAFPYCYGRKDVRHDRAPTNPPRECVVKKTVLFFSMQVVIWNPTFLRDLYYTVNGCFFFRTWMSPTIYITLQTGLIILQFSLKIVFFNRVVENVSPLTLKLQLFAFQKGVSRCNML